MRARETGGGRRVAGGKSYCFLPTAYCLLPTFLCLLLSACYPVTRPVVKIALVAPFEGRYRDVGYEVVYAVRLAVQEANVGGGLAGYSIELLSLDDSGSPEMAALQARKVAADPQVVGVIGHWLDATTLAAAPEYDAEGIPLLATTASPDLPASAFRLWPGDDALQAALPSALHCPTPCDALDNLDWLLSNLQPPTSSLQPPTSNPQIAGPPLWGQPQFAALAGGAAEGVYVVAPAPLPADSADPAFADRYRAITNGVAEPSFSAVLAYDAARLLFDAITRDVKANGKPTRTGVAGALTQTDYTGLSGHFSFDSNRDWMEAKGWVYQWREGKIVTP
jgi:ABC-type branched-subunit amino acid transport system substrate-binding protein